MRLVRKHHMFVCSPAPDSIIEHQDRQGGSTGRTGRAERGTSRAADQTSYFREVERLFLVFLF